MTIMIEQLGILISNSLQSISAGAKHSAKGRWEFSIVNGTSTMAHASIHEGWLSLVMPLNGTGASASEWRLLSGNRDLPGLCKYALNRDGQCRHLRVDLPLDCDREYACLPQRICDACGGFQTALKQLHDSKECIVFTADTKSNSEEPAPAAEKEELARLLDKSGWPFIAQSQSTFTVDLDARSGSLRAIIKDRGNRGFLAYTELAKWEELSLVQREALGIFLLTSCGIIRMARATVVEDAERTAARFEVQLTSPTEEELGHALAALSVAASLCGREAQAFEDEGVAKAYLAARKPLSAVVIPGK